MLFRFLNATRILEPVRGAIDSLFAAVQTRVELLAIELQEEKLRLVELLLLAVAVGVFGILFLLVFTFVIVLTWWEHRVVIAWVLLMLYGAFFAGFLIALKKKIAEGSFFLDGTLSEIRKDRAWLKGD